MTDNTQPDVGSTHIIRYALELGLLWIDGDGRNKVREALEALDILEARLEAIGAGGVQSLSQKKATPASVDKAQAAINSGASGGVQALSAAPAGPTSVKGAMGFTKKPVTIQAIQWTGENLREVITFTDGPPDTRSHHAGMAWDAYRDLVARDGLKIYTLEGKMLASPGDWIIRGVKGELYPCKPDIFQETYAAASPTPPAEQQAAPKAAPGEPDKLMRDCLALLESFDYEDDEDSQSKAFFNAHINADWFFHVKRSIERQLEAKAAPRQEA